jgi:hypothetical protein
MNGSRMMFIGYLLIICLGLGWAVVAGAMHW